MRDNSLGASYPGDRAWEQTNDGLEIAMPIEKPCEYGSVFKIIGKELIASE